MWACCCAFSATLHLVVVGPLRLPRRPPLWCSNSASSRCYRFHTCHVYGYDAIQLDPTNPRSDLSRLKLDLISLFVFTLPFAVLPPCAACSCHYRCSCALRLPPVPLACFLLPMARSKQVNRTTTAGGAPAVKKKTSGWERTKFSKSDHTKLKKLELLTDETAMRIPGD